VDDHDDGSFRPPAGCPLQGGDLPEELQLRLGGAADEGRARGHVRHDACLGPDLRCLSDPQVAGQRCLSANLDKETRQLVHRWPATGLPDDVGSAFRTRLRCVLAASWNFAVITGMENI
jgi:hypothetical protein